MNALVRALAPILALLALAIAAPLAHADSTVTVNTTADSSGGACESSGTGICSLREAVAYADDGARSGTVTIEVIIDGTIELGGSRIFIDPQGAEEIVVEGPGPADLTVDGHGDSRIFEVGAGKVAISGMTLSNGEGGDGGAILAGVTLEELALDEVDLSHNQATRGAAIYFEHGILRLRDCTAAANLTSGSGGAIYADADSDELLEIVDSHIDANKAGGSGGGIYIDEAELKVIGGTISGNSAEDGGGGIEIDADGGTSLIEETRIQGNKANEGGGIYVEDEVFALDPVVRDSWIDENLAEHEGGGIWTAEGMTVDHSTISNNESANSTGGGIYVDGEMLIRNSTIADNVGVGIYQVDNNELLEAHAVTIVGNIAGAGPASNLVGAAVLGSSVIAAGIGGEAECSGVIRTMGHNVAGLVGSHGCTWNLGVKPDEEEELVLGEGDQVNTDPMLGPLQENATTIPTMGPTSVSSPVINHGAEPESTDERGLPRPVPTGEQNTDVGAFELQAPALVTPPSIAPASGLKAGDALTCNPGGWDTETVEDATVHYAWRVAGLVVLEGQPTYTLVAGDVEKEVACEVEVDDGATATAALTPAVEFEAGRPGLSPASSAFGDRELGSGPSAPTTLTLRNEGGTDLDVESVASSAPLAFAVEAQTCQTGTPLQPGTSCAIEARFDPTTLGAQEATVTVQTSRGTVTATLTGTGVEPAPKPKPEPEPKPEPTPTPGNGGATPQPPAPSPTPVPVTLRLLAVARGQGALVLTVRCSGGVGTCRGAVTVSAARGGAVLAKGPLAAKAGKATVKLPLTAAGRRALADGLQPRLLVRATVHEPSTGETIRASARLTLGG